MKKILLFTFGLLLLAYSWAQAPQGFAYQAVIHNSNGQAIANQTVNFRLSLISVDGLTIHYVETHPVTTTPLGIANMVVGEGNWVSGSFGNIPWEDGNINLKVEVDPAGGQTFTEMGIVHLKSVPYALYAPQSGTVASTPNASDDDPIFVVRNKTGDIVFAVYQSGVRMYVDESTGKNVRGGFAIGGIGDNLKEGTEYFRVTPDSVRVNLREPVGKNVRGGFAIGGIGDNLKVQPSNLLYVGQDSVRIYLNTESTKGTRGGFAIGGIGDNLKGPRQDFLNVSTNPSGIINPSENRILWYPIKNAFLAGKVLIESPDSVGLNSFTTGYESKSIGIFSQAMGYRARAFGNNSTAIGNFSDAMGISSYAFGNSATVINSDSYAIGTGAYSGGEKSFAIGSTGIDSAGVATNPTKALGNFSYAFGMGSVASAKGAFAIGTLDTAAGDFSMVIGYLCKTNNWAGTVVGYKSAVTANGATAIGFENTASAVYSTALGYRTKTTDGWFSLAMGRNTHASGFSSTTMGDQTNASGNISTAMGLQTTASGPVATAIGAYSVASGERSVAIGNYALASAINSIAIGNNSKASISNAIAIGEGAIAMHINAIAIGYQDTASGNVALATGRWTKSSGIASFSSGDQSLASGQAAFSMGYRTNATGAYSLAAGSQSTAGGSYSFATGYQTSASTFGTVALGYKSSATSTYSIAAGYETTAQAYSSLVIGRYNVIAGNTSNWLASDPVFVIGNGTSTAATANALTVLKSGRIGIQTVTAPTYALELPNSTTIGIGQARANLWATYSDGRIKSNQKKLHYGINEIMKLRPVSYLHHNSTKENELLIIEKSGTNSIGLIAQEVYKIIPEAVSKPENEETDLWSMSYEKLIPVLINGMQEQQKQIDELTRKNSELEAIKAELEAIKVLLKK